MWLIYTINSTRPLFYHTTLSLIWLPRLFFVKFEHRTLTLMTPLVAGTGISHKSRLLFLFQLQSEPNGKIKANCKWLPVTDVFCHIMKVFTLICVNFYDQFGFSGLIWCYKNPSDSDSGWRHRSRRAALVLSMSVVQTFSPGSRWSLKLGLLVPVAVCAQSQDQVNTNDWLLQPKHDFFQITLPLLSKPANGK